MIYKLFLVVRHNMVLAISRKLARNEQEKRREWDLNILQQGDVSRELLIFSVINAAVGSLQKVVNALASLISSYMIICNH
jgi:hypothetical protein